MTVNAPLQALLQEVKQERASAGAEPKLPGESLDLREEMTRVRRQGIPVTVIGCDTDMLTPPQHCRRPAELVGGRYRELRLDGGHVWMFGGWPSLVRALDGAT
jgi:hypothetical protein